ncbi:MAG TPA: DUF418 domain-containing protein [Candidatus Agrococcus pullicola]|uniref:DUF418 domain-containing protein n=1 Tax=Candidatus Agrococcus pullicola TaxID=2838429 RepID=A0A9D1YV20_9MICO|nr:DUF418 domain-containing protein [Candidatus Agrococcus pullicola]
MLAGLAIGRSDLRRWMTAATVLGVGLVLSAVGYGAGAAYEAADGPTAGWEEPVDGIETVAPYDPGVELLPGEDVELTGMECEVYDDGWTMCAPEGELNTEYDEAEEYESWSASGWDAYSDAVAGAGLADRLLDALLDSSPHSGGSAEVVGSGGFAMALVGLLLLTGRWLRWPLIPIAAVGAMPLTAYSAQIVAIFVIGGPGGYIEDTGVFWATTAGLLAGCTLWIAFFGRGPLERVTKWVGDRMARG